MEWYTPFSALFFDLDGLLVNTEELHWKAYGDMCAQNGCTLTWDFQTYYSIASRSAVGVRNRLATEYPELFQHKEWDQLYTEKRQALQKRLQHGIIPLMPGVQEVLSSLRSSSIPIAVITHSPAQMVAHIRHQHDCFSVIQKWFTREDYLNPKPAPDGYITACDYFGVKPSSVIGFEDSLRGIEALIGAGCKPVLVQKYDAASVQHCRERGITTLTQIDEILNLPFQAVES